MDFSAHLLTLEVWQASLYNSQAKMAIYMEKIFIFLENALSSSPEKVRILWQE